MQKLFTLVCCLILCQAVQSQAGDKLNLLTGTTWQIASVWDKEASEKDYTKIEEDYPCLYDGRLKFEKNGGFLLTHTKKQCAHGDDKGKWKFNADKTKLIVESAETVVYSLELLTATKMILVEQQKVDDETVFVRFIFEKSKSAITTIFEPEANEDFSYQGFTVKELETVFASGRPDNEVWFKVRGYINKKYSPADKCWVYEHDTDKGSTLRVYYNGENEVRKVELEGDNDLYGKAVDNYNARAKALGYTYLDKRETYDPRNRKYSYTRLLKGDRVLVFSGGRNCIYLYTDEENEFGGYNGPAGKKSPASASYEFKDAAKFCEDLLELIADLKLTGDHRAVDFGKRLRKEGVWYGARASLKNFSQLEIESAFSTYSLHAKLEGEPGENNTDRYQKLLAVLDDCLAETHKKETDAKGTVYKPDPRKGESMSVTVPRPGKWQPVRLILQ